jgi:hypothetical protein
MSVGQTTGASAGAALGGRERTRDEFAALFQRAGFSLA